MSLDETLMLEQESAAGSPIVDLGSADNALRGQNGAIHQSVQPANATSLAAEQVFDTHDSSLVAQSWFGRFVTAFSGGSIVRKSALALIDQGVVSAVNFLTIVLLRRASGAAIESAEHELGVYQLGFSLVLLAACVQNALISTPYAVFGNRLRGRERKQYAGSTLVHQGMLSAMMTLILLAAGLVATLGWGGANLNDIALILAATLPFILTREFVRRLAFVHLQVVTVLLLDLAVGVLQLGGLWALKSVGHLTAVTVFCVMGAACAIAGLTALFLLRGAFVLRQTRPWPDLRLNWSFGKWAFAAQIVYLAMAYSPSWMLALFSGAQATGRFAVGMSLVMVANPVLIGLYNFLGPQAIYAYHAHGLEALRRLTVRVALLMSAAVGVLYALLLLFGGTLLVVFFGSKLQGQEQVVSILALSMVIYALSISAENGLTALNRPAAIFWANVIGLTVLVVAGCLLISDGGIIGAAWAATIGTVAAAACKVAWFYLASRRSARNNW